MDVQVYKFGGASVRNAEMVANLATILDKTVEKTVVVISAMGKMTNALEKVIHAYRKGDPSLRQHIEDIKAFHYTIIQDLGIASDDVLADINDTFVEIEWIVEEPVQDAYAYTYDQIVSIGELVSTKIVYHYLRSKGFKVVWQDSRDLIRTDDTHREAQVEWETTQRHVTSRIQEHLEKDQQFVITQGFIGSTSDNATTTLGREGSDFSAGIISFCLDATSLTIWKDVPGILNADPRKFDNVIKIDRLDYREAIEMTYFGAKVIHPKTIKPLQNKNIPLYVKPFMEPDADGTMITSDVHTSYPPVIVLEEKQCLIHFSTKDFSFVAEQHLADIFALFDRYMLKVNMMRNSAISFSVSVNQDMEKIAKVVEALSQNFNILKDHNLQLITIRHYDDNTVYTLKRNKIVIFEERLEDTIRMAVRSIPDIKYKTHE